ncbi:MAG: hypothetical protein FJ008_04250 [Chloroflexi bacterium]|nr:hypothetical protein [Chloroflexota bacterium]
MRNKLDPSLLEVVDKAEPNVEINVGIWLTEPGPEWSLPRPDLGFLLTSEDVARLDAERQEHEADAQRQMQTLQAGLLDELSSMGAPIRHASRFAPLVYTTLTRDGILHVAQRADVRYISLEGQGGPE